MICDQTQHTPVQVLAAQHLGDLDKLIELILAPEEHGLLEDERCHHAAHAPHVQRVLVVTDVHQQLRALCRVFV